MTARAFSRPPINLTPTPTRSHHGDLLAKAIGWYSDDEQEAALRVLITRWGIAGILDDGALLQLYTELRRSAK